MRVSTVLLAVLGGCASSAHQGAGDGRYELFVLGVAQDGGVPHFGCDKECCASARAQRRRLYQVCLGLHDRQTGGLALVEATPAVEPQVALLHELAGAADRGRRPVDAVLLTHAHMGHYLGLAHFGREVAGTKAIPVHLSPRFARYLRGHGPWKQLVQLDQIDLREFAFDEWFECLPGLSVRAIPVPHRDEFSDTVAYQVRGPNRTVLFVPDIDRWTVAGEDLIGRLLDGVDVAYVDGSFYDGSELPDRDMSEIPHPPMTDTMERFADRVRTHPGSVRFIHLNHTNPALRDQEIRAAIERRGFRIARRGERVAL